MTAPLTLDDILDLRAYERVRESFRREVMARKRPRRVALGPIMTLVFESVDTVRFQVQEMARVEKIISDEGIQTELDIYNRLLPAPGELSATVFIELTSEPALREWLPRLVGVERALGIRLGAATVAGSAPGEAPSGASSAVADDVVKGVVEAEHEQTLTRDEITAAVHYVRFPFTPEQVVRFAEGPSALVVDHPEYQGSTELSDASRRALLDDLRGMAEPIAIDGLD